MSTVYATIARDSLARRVISCRHWSWAPGMLTRCRTSTRRAAYRWLTGLDTRHYGIVVVVEDKHGHPCRTVATLQPGPDDLPDLDDPATLGCLLALVREAWGDETVCTAAAMEIGGVRCWVMDAWWPLSFANEIGLYHTEAEALVAALEAAP